MLKIKPQPIPVSLIGLSPQMAIAAMVVAEAFRMYTFDAWVTSATEGKHGRSSKHFTGNALDFSFQDVNGSTPDSTPVRNLRGEIKAAVAQWLGPEFDVVDEGTHLHVEFDPKHGVNQL